LGGCRPEGQWWVRSCASEKKKARVAVEEEMASGGAKRRACVGEQGASPKLRNGGGAKTKFIIDSDVCASHDLATADWPN
jgi:hypothetical protein